MWCIKYGDERTAVGLHLLIVSICLMAHAGPTLGCNCVPEERCPPTDVDLRLVGTEETECPPGTACCDVPVSETPHEGVCNGECRTDPCQCADEEYDEYDGTGLINIRTTPDGEGCPTGQYCCRMSSERRPVCDGTCVPKSQCTMFEAERKPDDGCTGEEDVCCRMNRVSWMGLINDINEMVPPNGDDTGRGCKWSLQDDGSRIPPWLVSVWARLEIIPELKLDQFQCSGVLLDPMMVMTTASCVEELPAEELFVNVGDLDLSNRPDLWMTNIYTVDKKMAHEDYNASEPVHHDVAILHLTDPVRNGHCTVQFGPSAENGYNRKGACNIIGWNREHLATQVSGRPRRYRAQVTSFHEDLFCVPGTICLDRADGDCDGESLRGSPVVCEKQGNWTLSGLLVANCSGVTVESIGDWMKHQRTPGFVQEPKPTDPSRKYLPGL